MLYFDTTFSYAKLLYFSYTISASLFKSFSTISVLIVFFSSRYNDKVGLREWTSATVVHDADGEAVCDKGVEATPHIGRFVDSYDVLSGGINPVLTVIPGDLVGVAESSGLEGIGFPGDGRGEVFVEDDDGLLGGARHLALFGADSVAGGADHGSGDDGGIAVGEGLSLSMVPAFDSLMVASGAVGERDGDGGTTFGATVGSDGQEAGLSILECDGVALLSSDIKALTTVEVVSFVG
jgi:hypothetical protein